MSLIKKLFELFENKDKKVSLLHVNDDFNENEYNRYNNEKIEEFKSRYDLTSVAGIRAIPIEEAKRYPDGGKSVVYMPEQILSRQATEYKNNRQYDLAIACLEKVNELYPYSFYAYTRNDYERLVDMMVLAGKFDEAKKTHEILDKLHGTRLNELQNLQKSVVGMGDETMEEYQERVIDPFLKESHDRECYYWLLENMPNIAPKSFGGFRRMKKINSSNYVKIVEEIRNKGYEINKLKFWYS